MRRSRRRFWGIGPAAAGAALALVAAQVGASESGAEAEAHGPDWWLLVWQVVNLGILGAILYRFVRHPLADFLIQRSRSVRQSIESAEQQLRDARQELASLRARIASLPEEAEALVRNVAEQAEMERERGLERAQATAERLLEETERVADQEIERARQALREEAAALAATLAGELIRDGLNEEDHRRLIHEYTESVGQSS